MREVARDGAVLPEPIGVWACAHGRTGRAAAVRELAGSELPLLPDEAARFRTYAPHFAEQCRPSSSTAYLEPWGHRLSGAFDLSQQLGRSVHAFGWLPLRRQLSDESRAGYDLPFTVVLRRALAAV